MGRWLEVVDKDGSITVLPQIVNFNQIGEKRINDILEQVGEAIVKHNISDYSRPVISAY